MLKKLLVTSLVASSLLGSAALANDTKAPSIASDAWEIGLEGVLLIDGANGGNIDNGGGLGLRAGYRFANNWSAVLEILAANSKVEGQSSIDTVDYIAGINYDIYEKDSWTPYLSLGLGYRTYENLIDDSAQIYPGLGIKWLVTDTIQLNLEGRGRWSLEDGEKGLVGTLGVSYRFGAR